MTSVASESVFVRPETAVLIYIFLVAFLGFLFKKSMHNKISLFDFLALSTLSIVPAFFVTFPDTAQTLAAAAGIRLPFNLLYGSLFCILFLIILNLIMKVNKLQKQNIALAQHLGILEAMTDSDCHTQLQDHSYNLPEESTEKR